MDQKRVGVLSSLLGLGALSVCSGTAPLAAQTPTLQVESKLTASDATPGNFFGTAVALRGRTAVVGAFQLTIGPGAAYVFTYNGNTWTQIARLAASDGVTGDRFGRAVAMGNQTIVVGAEFHSGGSGAAYVFELQGNQWLQTQKLVASDPQANAHFGGSVAIDGETLLVGAYGRNSSAGALYVFERSNGTWQQTALLLPNDVASGDQFSRFVSLEGDTVLTGSPNDGDRGTGAGSAYVFTRSNGAWAQSQKLLASDGAAADAFGLSGSLSGDTLVVGARGNDDLGAMSGAAYVFQLQNGNWIQTRKLIPRDGLGGDVFGQSVSLSGDRIVIGAKWRDDNGSSSGAAYVFELVNGNWTQAPRLNASDAGVGDEYGQWVAIEGPIVLIGAHRHSADRGAAYAYHPPNLVDVSQSTLTAQHQLISAYGGETTVLVTPRKGDGTNLGARLMVELSTSGGSLVGSVVDNGDGTYSQTLRGAPGASQAVVSAVVEGLPLTSTAVVTLLPVSLSASTVTVDPEEVAPGDTATVTVTPKTADGSNSGPGFTVVIETTLGTLTGAVVDNGDGTYSQQLATGSEGTASIRATVNGLPLEDTATLSIVPKTPAGRVVGLTANGTPLLYKSIQDAVDDAGRLVKIMLAPGHFDEVVRIRKCKDLTIQALPTLGLTTIRGLRIMHCQNVTIDGIHVDATNSKCRGVLIHKSDNVVLRNGLVQGTHRHLSGIRVRLDGGDVLLQNFGVLSCGGDGIHVKGDEGSDGQLTILGCVVQDNRHNGIYLHKDARVRIEACTIVDNGLKSRDRRGYGVLRERQLERKHSKRHHRCERRCKRHCKQDESTKAMGEPVLLLGNKVAGNHGRVKKGQSDENFGNYDQMIDGSDDQAPFRD